MDLNSLDVGDLVVSGVSVDSVEVLTDGLIRFERDRDRTRDTERDDLVVRNRDLWGPTKALIEWG